MDGLGFYLLVALVCVGAVLCQDSETLIIKEGPGVLEVDAGDENIVLTCDLNRPLQFILNDKIVWAHQSLVTPNAPVVPLTEQGTLKETTEPSNYAIDIDFTSVAGHILTKLTIKEVKQEQDGKFICQIVSVKTNVARLEQEIEIVVQNNVESVEMTFDKESPVTTVEPSAVNREEGQYDVGCKAGGFSPTAILSIFVGQKQVSGESKVELDKDASVNAGARRYTATTKAHLNLSAEDSGKSLRCVGKAVFDNALPKTASIPLQIIALEPTIECDKNISNAIGDRYVKITCVVDHARVEIEKYVFEIGETGELISPGNMTEDYHEVLVSPVNSTATQVVLDLYELDIQHVDELGGASYFYLHVHLKNGLTFRESAALYVRPSSSASNTAAAIFVILASLVLSL